MSGPVTENVYDVIVNGTASTIVGRRAEIVDMKLEVVVIPVSDVDRAKQFYGTVGWRLDADFPFDHGVRGIQFTPPGSGCLDPIRRKGHVGRTRLGPGPVPDRLRHQGLGRRACRPWCRVSEVFHAGTPGAQFQPDGTGGRVSGPRADVDESALTTARGQTSCLYKGLASHYDIAGAHQAAWSCQDAWPEVTRISGLVCFEPHKLAVHLGGTRLQLEPGQTVIPHDIDRDLTTGEAVPGGKP
jgi:catechol 2,3-dioxygenase-like lactoylglutathione lyase family enzyme